MEFLQAPKINTTFHSAGDGAAAVYLEMLDGKMT